MEIHEQSTQHAAKILGVSADYEIVFLANTEFDYLIYPEELVEELSDGSDFLPIRTDEHDFMDVLKESMVTILLPGNLRLVGMAKPGENQRVYGVIDFTGFV